MFHTWSFSPLVLRPALWLDASDASTLYDATSGGSLVAADGAIARWEDKSGNARHATQGTGSSQPLRKTAIQNGRDVIRFDGSNDEFALVASGLPSGATAHSVFVVSSESDSGYGAAITWGVNGNNTLRALFTEIGSNIGTVYYNQDKTDWGAHGTGFQMLSWVFTGTGEELWKNASSLGSRSLSSINTGATGNNNWIGGYHDGGFNEFLNGDIAEIIVYPTELSSTDRQAVERYLSNKYAITI